MFLSGNSNIRDEFVRLAMLYGALPGNSAAVDQAEPGYAPSDDILGRARGGAPDMGAFEVVPLTAIYVPLVIR